MEIIRNLADTGFKLFNVSEGKLPINRNKKAMKGWETKTAEELKQEHDYNYLLWGMSLGLQDNKKFILSLDFDCCGKPNKFSERLGCSHTKQKLDEWNQFGCVDGMYSSSTDGNFNVLIDYTNCPILIEKVRNYEKTKFNFHELEVLLRGNQVIPPSATVSKFTNQIGNPRQFLCDKLFLDLQPDSPQYNFIMNIFPKSKEEIEEEKKREKLEKQNKRDLKQREADLKREQKKEKKREKNDEEKTIMEELERIGGDDISRDKWLDLLFNVIGNNTDEDGCKIVCWDDWFHICGILKSNNYELETFMKYSEEFSIGSKTERLWFGSKGNFSIYGLQNLAKKYNKEGYYNWLQTNNFFIAYRDIKTINDLAKWSVKYLKDNLVYCNEKWFYYDNTGLWKKTKEPEAFYTTCIQSLIRQSIKTISNFDDDKKDVYDKLLEFYNKTDYCVSEGRTSSQLNKFYKTYLCNNDFEYILDDGLYKMVFKNGIWDMTTGKFRKGLFKEDYVTMTIPYDWEEPKQEDIDVIKNYFKKICNWNDKHLDYYLSSIGYSLTSDSDKIQAMWYFRGQTASNGKSLIFEVLNKIIPNYCIKQESNVLDEGVDNSKNMGKWKGLKILWLDELTSKKKDAELIKNIGNGTEMNYKRLYVEETVKLRISFKLFCVSEYSIDVKANNGFDRRFNLCQFNSKFDYFEKDDFEKREFVKDTYLIDTIVNKYKFALLNVLMLEGHKFYKNKTLCEYPIEWLKEKNEDVKDNDEFKEWFDTNFELNENGHCYKDKFNEYLNGEQKFKNLTKKQLKDNFARLKYNVTYDGYLRITEKDLGYHKAKAQGFWKGFVIKND